MGILFTYLFVCCLGICLVAFPVHEELFSWEHWGTLLQPCPALQQPLTPVPRGHGCALLSVSCSCRHPACSGHPEIVPTTHKHTSSACLPCVHAYVQQLLLGVRIQVGAACFSLSQNEMGGHCVPLQSPFVLSGEVLQSCPGILCVLAVRGAWCGDTEITAQGSQRLPAVGGTEPLLFFR